MIHKLKLAAGFLLLVLFVGTFLFPKLRPLADGDPDRYYHIALSRYAVDSHQPILRSLPQVEDLGWRDYFIDKEFLFHQITALSYRLAGEKGVEYSALACGLLAMLAFYLFAAGRLPIPAAVALSLLTFSSPFLMARLALLRPHTLAILSFILMNLAILARKPRVTAAMCFLFVLSYHAFYVPMACMAGIFLLSFLDEAIPAREWRRLSWFGLFGCVAGLLASPYFPGNIALAVIHARIPELMQNELRGAPFGQELVPVRSDIHLQIFHGPILVLMLAFFLVGIDFARRDGAARALRVRLLYLAGVAGFFLAVSFQITRAGEYLIPACALMLVLLMERWQKYWVPAAVVACLGTVGQIWFLNRIQHDESHEVAGSRVEETLKAVAAIPKIPEGAKVFNCEWDRSPYIMYARPDLRFVDILDPSLLYFANHGAYRAREELQQGTTADAYGLIHNAFKADFVLCNDQGVTAQLRTDPGFQQIYPPTQNPVQSPLVPSVFKLLPDPIPSFVGTLVVSEPTGIDDKKLASFDPTTAREKGREIELEKSSYLNLAALLLSTKPKSKAGLQCALTSPAPSEVARLAGADFLGVGGGQGLKVWRNGKPIFTTRAGFPTARLIQVLLPLPGGLKKTDRIDVLTCATVGSPFWGVALSLWTHEQLRDTCARKAIALARPSSDLSEWSYQGIQTLSCLGPIAAPSITRDLMNNPQSPATQTKKSAAPK